MATNKIRVLTISKPYVSAAYRQKLTDLSKDGRFEIALICPLRWDQRSFEESANDTFPIWKLPISFNGWNHFYFYLGLERVFREFRPDIVNIEEEHYSIVTLQATRLANKHHCKTIFYTWQNIHKNYPLPFRLIEKFVFRHASIGVCGNEDAAKIIRDKGFQGATPVIPQMGVDPVLFSPPSYEESFKRNLRTQLGLRRESFWMSYFGRLVPEKGIDLLLKAIPLITTEHPEVKCIIVGDGPEANKLRELCRTLAIEDRVSFIREVPSTEVPRYLQAVDVLCLPSLTKPNWKEQFGRILAEAMTAGTVVVGSNSGEIPRVIGKCGLIFAEGDEKALAGAVKKLIEKPTLWKELQMSGVKLANEHYSSQAVAKEFSEVFASLRPKQDSDSNVSI
ncbi:MAG: glycosyltransferase family 4 protein [Proteobacteria bacterium]|nr:glycosyltransferase family 4 protein [Pseudomonadota bacterium]